jgi:hypothetical protein
MLRYYLREFIGWATMTISSAAPCKGEQFRQIFFFKLLWLFPWMDVK